MTLSERLRELGYRDASSAPELLACVRYRDIPADATFMAKGMEAVVEYEMQDGSSFENRIAVASFFLVSSDGRLLDCFMRPIRPYEIKALEDWNALSRMHDEYRRDLEEAVKADRRDPQSGGANPCSA